MNLLGPISWPYRILALITLLVTLPVFGFVKGMSYQQDKTIVNQAVRTVAVVKRQAEVTVKVITKYVDRIQTIREQGAAIIKEVPVYVTKEDDARCAVPGGFVRLHDAAATNTVPGPARISDAQAAGIALSTVASTVSDNYGRCHENSAQLEALQEWVREQQRATNE